MSHAPLIEAGGICIFENFLSPSWFKALRQEGLDKRTDALEQKKDQQDLKEWRGGNPSRFLVNADGGDILNRIYADGGLGDRLSKIIGNPVRPTGNHGSYSYYDRPGHYLGLHRDIPNCDITYICCLDRSESKPSSGALRLYHKSFKSKLEDIDSSTPHIDIDMRQGQSVLLLGGYIPHEVLPAAPGFSRTISVMCFKVEGDL